MKLIGKFLFLVLISFLLAAHGQAQEKSPTRPPPTTCVDGVTTEFRGFSTGVAPFVYDERNPTCIPGYSGELDDAGAISQMITHTVECPDGRNDCLVLSRNIEDYFNGEVKRTAAEVRTFFNELRIHSTNYTTVTAILIITGVYIGTVEGGSTVEKRNTDRYRLTLKDGLPVLYDDSAIRKGDVLGFSPFSSLVVTHDPDEVDTRGRKEATTIRRVVIEFECSGEGHKDCLILKDASTSGATVKAKGEPLKVEWDIGGTAAQAQSSLRDLVVEWRADYNEPREATARVFLETSVRNIFGDVLMRNTIPFEYQLSFNISDKPPMLGDSDPEQTIFRAGERVFSSIEVTDDDVRSGVEFITSVRITQQCEPSCARLGLLPNASSMGFVITPGRYTTDTEVVQDFSHEGASTAVVQAFLRNNIAMASTSEKVLSVTLTVTVKSVLRGLARSSNTLEYSLIFESEMPTLSDVSTVKENLGASGLRAFSSIKVTVDPENASTIGSVVIEFECSESHEDCLELKGVPTGGATVKARGGSLKVEWYAGRTTAQAQSSLRDLVVGWGAYYNGSLVATPRVFLETSARNVFGDDISSKTNSVRYRLSFRIPDGGSLVLYASSTEQAVFRAGKRVFSAIRVSSPITVTGNGESAEELITSVRITQQCEPSCARLGLLPDASSMGFVITPGRYTTATEVNQYFLSTQGVSFSSVRALLSSNVAIASTSEKVLRVTLAVTVGSDLRGLNRLSNTLEYSLTFNGEPTVESTNREDLNVLRSFPFSSATVMDDPREADEVAADPREVDTIRSVVIEFECSGGRKTCVDVKDVSQTGGATVDVKSTGLEAVWDAGRTATQVQSFLQALGVAWSADYITPRVATARISLKTRVRNVLGDIAKHDTTPREYRLSFRIPDGGSLVLYASSTEQAVFRAGKRVFSAIRVSSPITVTGNGESVEELITSVRITQQCEPSCARLGLLPDASSMGFVITPGRYTTATEVNQYFLSTQGVSFSSVRALLSSNVAIASTSEKVLRVTLAVTVGSDLRGLNRLSNTLEYSLTFNGEPTVESTNREDLNVLRSFPFSSATVMDDPREADEVAADPREVDTIRSVVIEFECSGGRKTCVDVKDVSQTGGATVDVKSTGLEAVWDAGRTATQVQSFLQALGVAWNADYITPRVATARISLKTRVRNVLGDIAKHDTTPREYRLSFRIPDGGSLVLYASSTEQAVFRAGKRVFSAIRVSSPITVTGNGESVEELITSVRITQQCEPSCARLGLLPDASSMGFVITPGRYTTATEVNQYFSSTQGVSFSSVRALLSSNVAIASTSEKVLRVTLAVTVGSDLRGLNRLSNTLEYSLTFNGEPTVESTNREDLNVLRSFPFSSATVMDDPREADEVAADPREVDTIRSVVIEFECSGGRKTCVDVKDVSQTGGATVDVKSTGLEAVWDAGRTATQVQSFLQALGVAWNADYITPRVATARISLKTRVRNVLGDIAKHDTTPREYRLSFRIPDGGPLVLYDPSTEQAVFRAGKRVFSAIRVSSPITVTGNGESVEELITSVRITQQCEPSCARLGLLPNASSMGFVITPGRYTTATEVDQYFLSTQGVSFSRVQALLSNNIAMASTSKKVLSVTLTVTVGSDLRGLGRSSAGLVYFLTFNGVPKLADDLTSREGNVLGFSPFRSIRVTDDPREADQVAADPGEVDTIRSVAIEFECSDRTTCVDVNDVSQTTVLKEEWDAGRTATQVQSSLRGLVVGWGADYKEPREATARISLRTSVRNIFGSAVTHSTEPLEYSLSFNLSDGGSLVLYASSTEQAVFRAGKRVFSAIRVSSPITVTGYGESVEELITSVRITQLCEPSCARLGLLPNASSMGFIITPGRYTTATEVVQYILSTQGVSFSSVRALLSSNVAMASTSEKVLRVTLAVTVGSDLRGLNRLSNTLEYSLTFNGEPTVESTNRENLNVLRSFPFSSATVMDDPREADEVAADPREVDTIRSVVIEFECSGGRKTCVDVKDVSQTGGATVDVKSTGLEAVWDAGRTATQVQSFLQALGVAWNADYITPRVATARISLKTRVRNVLGDIAKHDTTPREYRLSFRIPDGGSLVLYASSTEQAVFRAGKRVFSAITVTGNGESVEELITSVRITQQCEPSCARLGLLPDASSMGFVITPGRYTTATEVNQYFLSTQGVSFSSVRALLSSNVAIASTSEKVLRVTLAVTVGSDLRGLNRLSNTLEYSLTFNGEPTVESTNREDLNVLRSFPFSSATVMDDPREADEVAADPREVDTIRSVVIEFECSGGRKTCVDVKDVSQTGGATVDVKSTGLEAVWDAGRTATQVQSFLQALGVAWSADYITPRVATARISLKTRVRNILGDIVKHDTTPREYRLSFRIPDGEPLVLDDPSTEQAVFRAGKRVFSAIGVSSPITVTGNGESVEELITSVRITQLCEPSCARLGLLPNASSMGFVITPGRYTTATEVNQYFLSTQGVSFSSVRALLSSNVAIASTSEKVLRVTLAVTVGSDLRGLNRLSNTLEYSLTFNGEPTVEATNRENLNVLRSFPFSSATVMDDPRELDEVAADPGEVDTIRSVVIEFECSGGRITCVDVKDVSQTGGATVDVKSTGLEALWDAGRTATQVQSFLQALGVAWSADYITPRVVTARISLKTRVRNILGDIAKHDTTPREYRLSFRIPDGEPLVLDDPSTEQAVFRAGKRVFSAIRVSSPITVTGNGESVEELITSVRVTQLCEPSCARLGLLPDASSMGFVITPGRYTTATEVNQYFLSTQGVSFSSVRTLLSSNVAMASTSEKVLRVTLAVTVGSDLRGLNRLSNTLEYSLTFNGEPTVESTNRENLNVLRSFPFSSATVMDDPREPDEVAADPREVDTIRSVVIEFECSGGRKTCVDVKDVSQTGGATVDVKSTGLEALWDAGRTATQVQSFLQALGVAWSADYITPRVATARISLKTRVRNILGDIAKHDTTPREYRLSFRIPDGEPLVLDDPSTEQAVFRAGKRVFSAIGVSSPITVTGNGESVEELITSVRITQLCEPSCARLGLLPNASSMGFVITPGRYTTATEVNQYFLSTQGVSFSSVRALLSSNVAIASTSEKVLRVTLAVTVGSDLRGLNRLSNTLEYSLTFNGEPTVESTNREDLNVLRSFPFSSATVMDDPREADEVAADPREVDTIRSVVIEFECSGGRKTCVDVKDVSQTGGATVDVKSTGLEAVWDAGRTATQVQSFLQALGVAWNADYITPRVATARISLKTRVRNVLGDIAKHDTTPREYRLSFRIPDGGSLVLYASSTEQAVFRAGKRVFSAIRVSSPITVTGNGESVEELITSVRITQQCEPSCARLGLLPDASSMGFVITPGRYTTATEVNQYFLSTQGVSFSSVRALLSSNVAMASTSEKVLRVTLAVTVGSDLRGLNRLSNTLEYSLTFNGEPTVESTNREDLNVLRSFPFSSATVMDDPREADEVAADQREVDTIRSVVIEFECSGGRKTCVDVKDVSQTGGATVDVKSTGLEAVWDAGRTATQVQSFLQALGVAWSADYISPRVATARISLKTRVRNILGDIAKHDTTPREYRLSFRIPDGGPLVLDDPSTEQAVFRAGKRVFSAIRVSSPITVTGNGESVEELITGVRITQQCKPSCARLGLLPDASSMGFVITPGRYTTATEVDQYFLSTQGVSFSRVQALLSNNIAMASTSKKVLSVTLTVTVGSDLRGLGRSSAGLVYFLTFNGVPKLADDLTSREGNVLGFSPFRSIRVTDDPREADQVAADPGEVDTIRSVAIEFECSDRTTCVDVNDVSQTTVLKEEWDAGRTATQVQSSLRGLVVGWGADYKEPREATARISLRTSVRNIFGSAVTHSTEPLEYSLSFNLSDGGSLVLYASSTEQAVFRAGKRVFSAIRVSSPITVTGNGESVEELITSVRITQQCEPSCARLGLLPNASSMGFIITPGRYTTATEVVQYILSTQGVSFSSVRALLSSNVAMASTSEKVLRVTLAVTVGSDLRGLNRLSNTLEYSLTFNGEPTVESTNREDLNVLRSFPFSSATVMDDPREADEVAADPREVDTIRSVVIEFECSGGRKTCVDVKDVSQTGGATVDVKSTGLEAVWDAGRTATQVQSFLQALGVAWNADYITPRVATARISLKTRVRNVLGDIAKHDTTPREYRLSFRIPDGGSLVLYASSTEQAVFRAGKRVFSAIRVSSPITVTGNGESVEELITSVRITQQCEPSCARLGLLPDASSMGFVITPGRYTTATEVNQYFSSTQGVSFSSVRALLSSNVAIASTSEKVLRVTLAVTVGSDLRGLNRLSNTLEYSLTFNGEPTVESTNREDLNVLRSFPFSSATVMDDPREADEVAADPREVDTIRSVVIEFECSGGRKTCVDVKDVSQTGGATVDVKSTGLEAVWDAGRTATQVQSFLQALGVAWNADYITPRVATARISLKTRVRNVLGDIAKHDTTPREYRLSFRIPDGGSLVLYASSTEQAVFRAGKRVFSAIRVSSPITVTGNGESVEELITSVRITQQCEPSCARLGLLPDASSMGFVITPGRYTTATEVNQYFLSTQGVSFSRVQALLSNNIAMASTSNKVLSVTLTVTVGSDLRGLGRSSAGLVYFLTFNGVPKLADDLTSREGNVLGFSPFRSIRVTDDPREADQVAADPGEVDTIRSVAIEFECSDRTTCVDVNDVSQTTVLKEEWDAGRTATQVQSSLRGLVVGWGADYKEPREATARISLRTSVRNIFGSAVTHSTEPLEYSLSFNLSDGGSLVLYASSTEQAVFRAGKRVFSAIRVSSPITVTGNGESVEELITSVRITQQCKPSCARLGLLPDASSMGFVITPGRYTTATEVNQYFLSTQGVSFSSVRALLSSNVAIAHKRKGTSCDLASTSEKVLRVTLAVTVGSDLRGLNRLSNTLEYSLTFNGEPTVESTNREDLNVLRSFPFSSATVMDDPREADEVAADPREVDTIRSVVIEFECSGGRKTCVDVKDVSQTGGATVDVKSTGLEAVWDAGRTATQVQSFLQALGVAWNADYITPRVATARISLKTRVRNVLGDIAKHDTTPREYRLPFRIPDGGSLVLYASSTEQAVFRAGKRVFSAIRVSSPITVTGNGESVEELITSVRITQQCEPSCARLGLLPDASSMGFVITPGRYTTATEVNQYFLSTQGVSFSSVRALLSSNVAIASTSEKVLRVTLTVTVGSDLRGLGRSSAGLVYFLTFNGVPKLADDLTSREGNVLGFSPFRSIRVTDDPREADQVAADPGEVDTIRSVAIEFECSDRTTCVDVNDVSQTTVLKEEWDAGRTATQVQSSLRGLVVGWGADYKEPREATARISLRTSVRNIFGSAVTHSTEPLEYSLSFNLSDGHSILSDGEPLVLYDPNTEQTVFRAGKKVFSAIIISSPIIVTGNGKSVEELVTSVRITQQCKPSCARLGLLPNASSMGFVITPGRYTTATEVDQYFLSTQGVTFSSIRALLSSNIAMASTSEKVLSVTLTVTVESDLRGLNRLSNTLEYSLTFNGAPTLSDVDTSRGGYVLGFSPFSSITVTDDPGEVDTIRSVVIEFECSRGRAACVDVKGVSRTGGATVQVQSTALKVVWDAGETAKQVQSSLRGFVTVWGADYKEQRKATARVVLGTSVRNILGDDVRHSTEPLEYSLSFNLSSDLPRLDDPNTEKTGPAVGFLPLSAITIIGEAIEGVPETISDINGTLKCVNRATTCASFVGVEPGDFSGTTLGDAEMFLRGLQVRSRFASYEAKLTVSVVTSLNGLERPSNELTYTLTFPTPGSTRDRLIAPAFAVDLKVVNPYLDMINPENLAAVKEAVVGHCIGDYFEDSDDDGVPNNVEAQLGTDCLNRDRNSGFNNVAGDKGRPYVRVVGELVLDQLPFIGNLDKLPLTDSSGDPGIECQTCVEVLFLEIQPECTSASSDSVVGNGNISFPGVNVSSCYLVGRFSSSPTGSENSTLYGTLFPRPGWSGLYVLGIDKYGNWSVDGDGVLETLMVYTPPVLSLGPDVYSITDKANIGVELRGRRTPPSVVYTPTAPGFTLFGDTRESGSFGTYWERDHRTVLVDVSSPRLVTLVATDIFDRSPPYFVMGRSTLTVIQDSPPSFISIGLQKDGRSAAVISLEDDANSYSLNVSGGAQSTVTIVDGEVMVMEGEEVMVLEDVGDLLDRVRGMFDGVATLKVRVSSTDNTVEAQFPVFSSTKTAASAAAWTRAVVNRDIVVTSCLTDLCAPDNPFAYASVNLGPGAYLSHVIASSLRDFPVSFDKVRETLNEFVSGELSLDPDLNGTELLTDVISYSGAASNVSETTASFVFDLRHKPFTKDGRLVKRILVDGEYKWRGVANLDEDGSVWYTTKRDSTCPSSDDDSAWSDTDNGFIPASASTPVRCVRLDIVDGGLYANGSNGYYSGSIFGAGADAFPLAHVGGGRAYDSYDTWLIVFVVLAALLYSGSAGVWTILTLLMVIALSVWRRRRVAVHSEL